MFSARQNEIARWVKSRQTPNPEALTSAAVVHGPLPPYWNVRWLLTYADRLYPGVAGGGGGGGGPCLLLDSSYALNERLAEVDATDDRRHIGYRAQSVAEDFAGEQRFLSPLPGDGLDTGTVLWPRADKFARISVGKCRYSVQARLIGKRVRIQLTANDLVVYDGSRKAAVHPRLTASGAERLDLDHYLEILLRKPGALPGSVPLAQARKAGVFTPAHEALWSAARTRLGDGHGTRALIEVLLLHRRLPDASVIAGITAALNSGYCSPDVVALEAREYADAAGRPGRAPAPVPSGAMPAGASVLTLPRRREPLPADGRPVPSVAAYDQLLARPAERRRVMSARRDELTDTAADAAIDTACRVLRLPTIRDRHGEVAAAAARRRRATKGS